MEDLKKCQLNSVICGHHREKLGCVILKNLTDNLGIIFNADILLSECELICERAKGILHFDLDINDFICAKHRFIFGKGYRPSTGCAYNGHPINSKCKGEKISWHLYEIVKTKDSSFILGSLICKPCQKILYKTRNEEQMECDEDDIRDDPDFTVSASLLDDVEKFNRREKLDSMCTVFEVDRVRHQINSDIENLSTSSLNYFRNVHQQLKNKLTDTFCYLVAPGQEEKLKKVLENENNNEADRIITHLREAFDMCSSQKARQAILMLVPETYSKPKVSELFECSLYEVKKARKILKLYGVCSTEPKKESVYSRLSFQKAQHFVDFLFSTNMIQEVAYGTTKLKLDSGDKITVGNTILNGIFEHSVKEYAIYCREIHYQPLGRTTLLKMLHKMKPHTRTKLAGVDSFVVEGIEGFEALRMCLNVIGNNDATKELLKCLNSSERYLKARYKTHCKMGDPCKSHCINHALSHPTDKELQSECDEPHTSVCEECQTLVDSIETLKSRLAMLPSCHEKEVAQYEAVAAERKVLDWQKHIMRGVQQSKARSDVFNSLTATSSLWIRDFAQKYLPSKTLEAMTEYFGKRGMTVSVEVFISKAFNTFQKQVYLVALDRCDQGSLETLCIADVVLEQFIKDNSHIKTIELKSDNAGNYHANGIPECMYFLAQKRGIKISAYNYNEAQLGKDQCDREAAFFKNCAERWLLTNETNKISNAVELVDAVFSNGGPKNTKMCVIKIDKTITILEGVRNIKNISYYHSVEFQDTGALYREFYNIGKGKFHKYNDIQFVNGASFVMQWRNSVRQEGVMICDNRNKHTRFVCPEMLCVLEFVDENEMMCHVASGDHKYANTRSGMDKAILYYAQQKHVQNTSTEVVAPVYMDDAEEDTEIKYSQIFIQGWARKVRRVKRITPKQKEFITKLFNYGAATKVKLSAEQMAQQMQEEMTNGQYYFQPDEYMDAKRIRSLISRLKKDGTKPSGKVASMSEDDGIEYHLDDIVNSVVDSDCESDDGGA